MNSKWFPIHKDNGTPKIYCFYHAGGNANFFLEWSRKSKYDIIPVELPGHGRRHREELPESIDAMAKEIAEDILRCETDFDFGFWGHSMGALLAFQTAFYLEKNGNSVPRMLIVSGRQAPFSDYKGEYQCSMGKQALVDEIKRLGLLPELLLNSQDYMDEVIPLIFNDYRMNEEYVYHDEKVNIPVVAHFGSNDIEATERLLAEWKEVTKSSFSQKAFKGSHFYVYEEETDYLTELESTFAGFLDPKI